MNYKMIGYYVFYSKYFDGYYCDFKFFLFFMNIVLQKNFVVVYYMGMYVKKELYNWFVGEYFKYCKYKLDMGKSCI